jgi:hydrogenase nickel incorporation protein HypB
MCATCGCSDHADPSVTALGQPGPDHHHPHDHEHAHDHHHDTGTMPHVHARPAPRIVQIEQDVLAKNDRLAEHNRGWLDGRGIRAWNLMSSPGAGKTTLLERTIRDLGAELPISVIEGDQATLRDAERIRATGCPVVQINTGSGCHLDAAMLAEGLRQLDPQMHSLLMIENVGNLVCPALFDLGEHTRAVIMSVTEGEDKPLKYPHMFRASEVMVLSKIDLLPHLEFDVAQCLAHARRVNPRLEIVEVSARSGDGLEDWYGLLRRGNRAAAV